MADDLPSIELNLCSIYEQVMPTGLIYSLMFNLQCTKGVCSSQLLTQALMWSQNGAGHRLKTDYFSFGQKLNYYYCSFLSSLSLNIIHYNIIYLYSAMHKCSLVTMPTAQSSQTTTPLRPSNPRYIQQSTTLSLVNLQPISQKQQPMLHG